MVGRWASTCAGVSTPARTRATCVSIELWASKADDSTAELPSAPESLAATASCAHAVKSARSVLFRISAVSVRK